MDVPKIGEKAEWLDGHDDLGNFLLDGFHLEPSFIQPDLLDLSNLGNNSGLTLDSESDAFLGLNFPGGDLTGEQSLGGAQTLVAVAGDQISGGIKVSPHGASPSTSESGNLGISHAATDSFGLGRNDCEGGQKPIPVEEDEAKRLARMQRNRENAHLSRQRKKQQMLEMQQTCIKLKAQNTQITCLVHRLVAENCLLRHHLANACKEANIPVPDVPSAMKSASMPPGTAQQAVPQQTGMASSVLLASHLRQMPSDLPVRVPPTAPTVTPVAAATSSINTMSDAPVASTRPVRKRARMSGAGAAFLAMFSLFMFVGPYIPGATPQYQAALPGSVSNPLFLPSAQSSSLVAADASGDSRFLGRHSRALLEVLPPSDDSMTPQRERRRILSQMVNETVEALLEAPDIKDVSAAALQQLQDLAPAAVLLDPDLEERDPSSSSGDKPAVAASPLAVSSAFPLLANQFFKVAGLDAPQACRKVFEFEASDVSHPQRSRRSVERYIMGTYGFKGRSVGPKILGPVQLSSSPTKGGGNTKEPAALVVSNKNGGLDDDEVPLVISDPSSLDELSLDEKRHVGVETGGSSSGSLTLPPSVSEPTLVSVLLPANSTQASNGELTAVDHIFVVLLHPQDRFVTYSCGLPRSLVM